jgi:hypothetical protein
MGSIVDFFKKISVEENQLKFQYFKIYIIIWFSRYSVLTHLRTVNFQNWSSQIPFQYLKIFIKNKELKKNSYVLEFFVK